MLFIYAYVYIYIYTYICMYTSSETTARRRGSTNQGIVIIIT